MDTAIVRLSRRPGNDKRDEEGRDPDGGCDEEGLDVAVFQRLHDGREEVLECLGEERGVLQKNKKVDAPVGEDGVEGFLDGRGGGVVCLAGVVDEAPLRVGFFFVFEPAGCSWIVRKQNSIPLILVNLKNIWVRCSRDKQRQGDSDASLDDKQPPPASDSMGHVQVPQDACADESAKGVCEGASCIEPGDAVAQFLAGIPARPVRWRY